MFDQKNKVCFIFIFSYELFKVYGIIEVEGVNVIKEAFVVYLLT